MQCILFQNLVFGVFAKSYKILLKNDNKAISPKVKIDDTAQNLS
ncbi:hypothetical protein [Helicobacter bilis]|nr:hypothetical protein [Helicobacter bilis]